MTQGLRRIAWIVPVGTFLFFALRLLVPLVGDDLLFRIEKTSVGLLVAWSSWRAALSFGRGDYLRKAWLVNAANYFILGVTGPAGNVQGGFVWVSIALLVNVLGVSTNVLFGRAYRVAGVELGGSRARKLAIVATAAALALVMAGYPIIAALIRVSHGQTGFVELFSSVGDVLALVFIAPVLMTALALRGGLLVWPWALLAGSGVAWLLFDAVSLLSLVPGISPDLIRIWPELWQLVAGFMAIAAALTQRRLSTVGG